MSLISIAKQYVVNISKVSFVAAVAISSLACGGAHLDDPVVANPEILVGSVSYTAPNLSLTTTAPSVLNLGNQNPFWIYSPNETISGDGTTGTLNFNGTIVTGPISFQHTPTGVSFTFASEGSTVASGSFHYQVRPSLDTAVSVPTAGTYTGQCILMGSTGPAGIGGATATVKSDGSFNISFPGMQDFVGIFSPSGSSAGTGLNNGSVFTESSSQYSYDGNTLKVRVDSLALTPQTAWMALTKQ